ncbi:hypothetical protein AVEN_88932-1 [Araneus ventricosus]|uniref:Uncharacterized protein n=1 Tax=Araneus ventricosus TaxID=182803 RepID=A0A4Y1ZT38_ARAVE|nr:hypothetical protein AVEN_88932-1 [Araneus ventricosus]
MTRDCLFQTAADVKGVGHLHSRDSFVSRFLFCFSKLPFVTRDTFATGDSLLFLEVTRDSLLFLGVTLNYLLFLWNTNVWKIGCNELGNDSKKAKFFSTHSLTNPLFLSEYILYIFHVADTPERAPHAIDNTQYFHNHVEDVLWSSSSAIAPTYFTRGPTLRFSSRSTTIPNFIFFFVASVATLYL